MKKPIGVNEVTGSVGRTALTTDAIIEGPMCIQTFTGEHQEFML